MALNISAIPGCKFGVIVTGLEMADLDDADVRQSLYDLWLDKGLVVFRDIEDSSEMHVRLSKVFGELEEAPRQG